MSALNFSLQKDLIAVSTDTLSLSSKTHLPSHYQSKMFPVLHLNGVICGTGISQFIVKWYVIVSTEMLSLSIPELDKYTPNCLIKLAQTIHLPAELSSTIYHLGYDQNEKRFRGFAYRSENKFISEELPYSFVIKPAVQFKQTGKIEEDFIKLISLQREYDLSRPVEKRIGIGGEVQILVLLPGQITMISSHRFSDYESIYEGMCSRRLG